MADERRELVGTSEARRKRNLLGERLTRRFRAARQAAACRTSRVQSSSTRTPIRANSRAIGSVIATIPPFEAEYAACPICPSNAATDAVLTMTPRSPPEFGSFCGHGRGCETDDVERADEIHADDPLEMRERLNAIFRQHPLGRRDAGGVDQAVHAAELGNRHIDRALHVGFGGDVAL